MPGADRRARGLGGGQRQPAARTTPRAPRRSRTRSPSSWAGGRPTWSSRRWRRARCTPSSRRGFGELVEVGLVERTPIRYVGGQACRLRAHRERVRCRYRRHRAGGAARHGIVRSLAIGNPRMAPTRSVWRRRAGGAIYGVADELTVVDSIRLLAETEGILTETAGGVTLAALRQAVIEAGTVGRTTRWSWSSPATVSRRSTCWRTACDCPSRSRPTYEAFESWWEAHEGN